MPIAAGCLESKDPTDVNVQVQDSVGATSDGADVDRIFKPFETLSDRVAAEDQKRLRTQARRAITASIVPGFQKFLDFMHTTKKDVWDMVDAKKDSGSTLKSDEDETTKAVVAAIKQFQDQNKAQYTPPETAVA